MEGGVGDEVEQQEQVVELRAAEQHSRCHILQGLSVHKGMSSEREQLQIQSTNIENVQFYRVHRHHERDKCIGDRRLSIKNLFGSCWSSFLSMT